MSIQTITAAKNRITSATQDAPFSVFKGEKGKVDVVVTNTIRTRDAIVNNPDYIGTFYGFSGMREFGKLMQEVEAV